MQNYVYIYYNEGMRDNITPEAFKAEWGAWFGFLGEHLVDAGNPFAPNGNAVESTGVTTIENWPATGYSIVKASSLAEATEWAKACPVLKEPKGAVRVYQTMPM